MPRASAPKESQSEQSTRFIEKARELGTNDDPAAFDALFGKLVPPVVPEPKEQSERGSTMSDEGRVPERTIAQEALRLLAQAPGGFMTTSELQVALESLFEPAGEDAEILEGRSDTKFSQKVRNLVSHRDARSSLETKGYATYDKTLKGWTITPLGRDQA